MEYWDPDVETSTEDEMVSSANLAWRALAGALGARSRFYAAKFSAGVAPEDVDSVRELERLPTTTRDEVREDQRAAPPFGRNLSVPRGAVVRSYRTSGSSGAAGSVALTAGDVETWTTIGARSYTAAGMNGASAVLTTLAAGPFAAGHTHLTIDRIGAARIPVAPGDTRTALAEVVAGRADTLLTTPSFALHLAAAIEEQGFDGAALRVEHVLLGGEPGGGIPTVRARVEKAFGAVVTEVAGIGEIAPSLFAECRERDGMHFSGAGLVWLELLEPSTQEVVPMAAGATGELVYTTLVREAMPLVRFRSGDLATVVADACPCRRTSPRFRIIGRSDDAFVVRGVNVYPSAIQEVVAGFRPAVTGRARVVLPAGADVVVEPPVTVEVEIPAGGTVDPALVSSLETAIRERLVFRALVRPVPQEAFGEAGYKTPLRRES